MNSVRAGRKEAYTIILSLAARAGECFNSALIRQKLLRSRPENPEIGVQVDEDIANGWAALEELGYKLQDEQLICSDSIVALLSDARTRHFWNAESLFRLHGHAALDLEELNKHTRDLVAKLRQRCRREIGLTVR